MEHKDFIKTLKSDISTPTGERARIDKEIRERLRNGEEIDIIAGVFGAEGKGTDGYVERVDKPKSGGTFTKIYGCSFLYKGYPDKEKVKGLDISKALFSQVPRGIIAKSIVLSSSIGFLFLFARKRFIRHSNHFMQMILERTKMYQIPSNEYSRIVKEMKRTSKIAINKENNAWSELVGRLINFFVLFIENDNSYRFRLQDAVNEAYIRKNMSIFTIINVLIERETTSGMKRKWKFINKILTIVFMLSPSLKRISKAICSEIDVKEIRMDKDDWYFCLRFKSYNFKGIDIVNRLKIKDEFDVARGHIFIT